MNAGTRNQRGLPVDCAGLSGAKSVRRATRVLVAQERQGLHQRRVVWQVRIKHFLVLPANLYNIHKVLLLNILHPIPKDHHHLSHRHIFKIINVAQTYLLPRLVCCDYKWF